MKAQQREKFLREIATAIALKKKLLRKTSLERIVRVADLITVALRAGKKVLLCGNGGSAADCQHWAGEMVGRFRRERQAFPFIALTTNTSVLTSIGNDYSFTRIFSRQVEGLGEAGDILICLSTSGTSANVLSAARTAGRKGMKVISLTGRGPNPLTGMSDAYLAVPSDDTPRIQEIHGFLIHLLCGLVEENLSAP